MIRNDTSCYVTPIQNWEVRLGMTTTRPACPPRIPTKQVMQSINASSQYTYIHLYSSRYCMGKEGGVIARAGVPVANI
jgi:hypothetical protein